MDLRKKKRTRDFMRMENLNKTMDKNDYTEKIEDFGRKSNLMDLNVNKNLDKQKNNIFQRLQERRQRY